MIDTIILKIPTHKFKIMDHTRFSPSSLGLFQPPYYTLGSRGNFLCVQNPTPNELREGNYKPRLTLAKRIVKGGFSIDLKIELSLPKLLYGNNFDELEDKDFWSILLRLHKKLWDMGVALSMHNLVNANVSGIHYSKNIPITDFSTSDMVISELSKINLTKKLDLSHTDFRNEGHILRYHANSFEIAYYDKIKDLKQAKVSGKRALEKDNEIQLNLFDRLAIRKPFEVVRMEVRLNTKQKILQILEKVGIYVEPTFYTLFSSAVSQRVLSYYLVQAEEATTLSSLEIGTPSALFESIRAVNPRMRTGRILEIMAGLILIQEKGVRGFRVLMANNHAWYRMKQVMDSVKRNFQPKYRGIQLLKNEIISYNPLRLKDYIL